MIPDDFDEFFTYLPLADGLPHTVITMNWKKEQITYLDRLRMVLHCDVVGLDNRRLTKPFIWNTSSRYVIGKLMSYIIALPQQEKNALYFTVQRKPDNTYIITDILPIKAQWW